ncbi:uncharacterized protein AKAME5_000759600 [Lates japonicus]|uniref:Uncharacterized protein n=1 Tax=Lates japonicus TaxID=270547 RepID=A0AAD3R4P9_LATJO|nr:uncharacterized protein AKAME5_000759600 [Lates japonicus]
MRPMFQLMCWHSIRLDLSLSHADFVTSLTERLTTAFTGARQRGADAHEEQKLYYDRAARHQLYAEGDLVWMHDPTEDRRKLAPNWKGPYRVLAVLDSQGEPGLTYRVGSVLDSDGPRQVVHYDRLKPYTLPLPAGSISDLQPSPPHAPLLQDGASPEVDWREEDQFVSGGTGTVPETGVTEPKQTVSHCGRVVRKLCLRDFVTY